MSFPIGRISKRNKYKEERGEIRSLFSGLRNEVHRLPLN